MYRYPFAPFPNGWFQIAFSDEIKKNQIKTIQAWGQELVAFRIKDGKVTVADAHCPHLGAHLGKGGKIVDDCLECPFHLWRYNNKGECVHIPYAKRPQKHARLKTYPTCEQDGNIYVFFHDKQKEPEYMPKTIKETYGVSFKPVIRRTFKIRVHPQEVVENLVDVGHFPPIHRYGLPNISVLDFKGPIFHTHLKMPKYIFGIPFPSELEVTYFGPGLGLSFVPAPIKMALSTCITPIDNEYSMHRFSISINSDWKGPFKWAMKPFVSYFTFRDYGSDINIWENKRYLSKPMVCMEDGPIIKVRNWFEQFYPAP